MTETQWLFVLNALMKSSRYCVVAQLGKKNTKSLFLKERCSSTIYQKDAERMTAKVFKEFVFLRNKKNQCLLYRTIS